MTKALCIYHGDCTDGFAAAWCVRKALGVTVDFHPGVYQKSPPDVTGRPVILVDFSYKRYVLERMIEDCESLLVLDHHKTARDDLAFLPVAPAADVWFGKRPMKAAALFDMQRSGAGIAWDYFHEYLPRPKFIDYVEDRDLWRNKLPQVDEFTFGLRSYEQSFSIWDGLIHAGPDYIIKQGEPVLRYYRQRVDEFKKAQYRARFYTNDNCYVANVVNVPYFAASEVAGEIATPDVDFGACYFEDGNVYKYSLRSRDDFDVSKVALHFGGGGHRQAAGFSSMGLRHTKIIGAQ